MKEVLTYDDVLLVPQYSDIRSRSEVSLHSDLGNKLDLNFPVIASPMDTVTEADTASTMSMFGGTAVIHRYNSVEEQVAIAESMITCDGDTVVGAAVGVTGDFLERAQSLFGVGVDFICVDVAHGHSILMKEALETLRNNLPDDFHIMAGNVATLEGFNDLADWGANSIRCNIGGGSICTTRVQTGHGLPGLETILQCAKSDRDAKIIADGGIKTSGDIVKALAAGADAVMLGSLLAGTDEAPGRVFSTPDGQLRKEYRGMASAAAQNAWRGKVSSLEGVSSSVPYKGSLWGVLDNLDRGMRSGLSYSGCRTIAELQAKAQWVKQTGASQVESSAHILRK